MVNKMSTSKRTKEDPNKCFYHKGNAEVAPDAVGYVPGLWTKYGVCEEHAEPSIEGKYSLGRPILYESEE